MQNNQVVHPAVGLYSLKLNEAGWSSADARARGLSSLLMAQLGSDGIDGAEFAQRLAERTVRELLPRLLREVIPGDRAVIEAATRCEREGTSEAARAAANAAANAAAAPGPARAAASAASTAANSAAKAATAAATYRAAAERDAVFYIHTVYNVASAAASAAHAAFSAAHAAAERDAGYLTAAVAARGVNAADGYLIQSAELAVGVLREWTPLGRTPQATGPRAQIGH